MATFRCASCDEEHEGPPLSYGSPAPAVWLELAEAERSRRGMIGPEQCELDEHRFVRGLIEIPIIDAQEKFAWDVWVSLSPKNYERMSSLWTTEGREGEPPYFGWLSTALPSGLYPATLNLKTMVHTRPVGLRPFIELEPSDHPLAVEQRNGITLARVQHIAELLLHGD